MGLDFGTKRLGIAVSTPDQNIASPLENYDRKNPTLDEKHLRELAEDYRIAGLVVGLPVHMSGDEGGLARSAREFGLWIAKETNLPLRFWDERFTSAVAEEILQAASLTKKQRKARKDKLAAYLLLQSFLDAKDREQKPQAMD
jgi:putative Holliday junction resolvase